MSVTAPLVRNQDGAVLGVDYRQTDLAPVEMRVPGRIPARAVMPGDTIQLQRDRYVVHGVSSRWGRRYLSTVSAGGAPVVFEHSCEDRVNVVEVGAFEVRDS